MKSAAAATLILAMTSCTSPSSAGCIVGNIPVNGLAVYIKGSHRVPGSVFANCYNNGLVRCFLDQGIEDLVNPPEVNCQDYANQNGNQYVNNQIGKPTYPNQYPNQYAYQYSNQYPYHYPNQIVNQQQGQYLRYY